jgi:hypothetical protein
MKSRNIFVAVTLICGLVAQGTAFTQTEKLKWYQEHFTYFYRNPRPERLVGLVERWQSDSGGRWDSYPPLVGFLAVVFKNHPEWIERLIPANLTPDSATAVAGALRLAGDPAIAAEVRSRIAQAGSDPILKKQLAGLPAQLTDLKITLPTHLDILWGASSASGDDRYVLKIIDFFATIANQSEQVAVDITKIATNYPNAPTETKVALRRKYGDRGFYQLALAATSLWAITSNARQHTFIKKSLVIYTSDHMGTPAANAIIMNFPQMLYFLGEGRRDLLRGR